MTVQEFKAQFDRDQFSFGTVVPDIRDSDIAKALTEAEAVFNGDIYPTEAICKLALSYLTAHFLQLDAGAGETNGQAVYNQTSRSVGSVSESVQVPDWMQEGEFAFYSTTYYGQKWLILSRPYLVGAVYSVPGATQP